MEPNFNFQHINLREENLFSTFSFLRKNHPVCQIGPDQLWAISRYQDINHVFAHPETFSSEVFNQFFSADWLSKDCQNPRLIVAQDPPEHKKYRSLLANAFNNSNMKKLIPLMQESADTLVKELKNHSEFMSEFSYPYIGNIIRHITGTIDRQSLTEVQEWIEYEERLTPLRPNENFIKGYESAIRRQRSYFLAAIKERRKNPKDDLLSFLLNSQVDGELLTDNEICSLLDLVIAAGFTTTIQSLNHAIIQLSRRPNLLKQISRSPELIPAFVEELLRYSPPTIGSLRITKHETCIAGTIIPKGAIIFLLIASANRDPALFENPDTFDIHRNNSKKHFTFGHGIHKCVGATLLRLELQIALESILKAYEQISCPDDKELDWVDSNFVRAVKKLPISFENRGEEKK